MMRTTAQTALSAKLSLVPPDPAVEYPQAAIGAQEPSGVNAGGTEDSASARIKRERKRTPEEQGAFLYRMLTSAARRAAAEDPGRGLAMLLQVQALVDAKVDEVGCQLVAERGPSQVADDLSYSSVKIAGDGQPGEPEYWDRRRVHKRWGPASPAAQREETS